MARSISLGSTLKAAGAAVSKASKVRSPKAGKASKAKASKADSKASKAAPKADALGASFAVPQSGTQADYRKAVVAAFRAVGGAAKALADLRVDADKLKAACKVSLAAAVKHGSIVVLDGNARFTDRGVAKYAAFDTRKAK